MKNEKNQIVWVAVCLDCHKELERCPNGHFAEGAARYHVKNTECNKTLIGYEIVNNCFKARIETMTEKYIHALNAKTYGEAQAELAIFVENQYPEYISAKLI